MADTGITEVAATVQELVESMAQEYLVQASKLIPTVTSYTAPAGMDKLKIPRAGGFTPAAKVENTAVTTQTITWATDDLDLDQYKAIQILVEDNAKLQANINVEAESIKRMALDMALDIDTYLVTQIAATSAAAPDHRILYANNATDNTLGKADVLAARELLHVQNVVFSDCFMGVSPASEADLLAIDDFVHVDKYGSSATGLMNGELGRLYGARVIMSNEFDTAKTLIWHPSHVGFAMQMAPKFETDRDVPKLADLYSLSNLYGAVTLDSGKRGVLLGTAA